MLGRYSEGAGVGSATGDKVKKKIQKMCGIFISSVICEINAHSKAW